VSSAILDVPNISCHHCAQAITSALTPLEGVQSVQVDIPAKQVKVTFDERFIDIERMKEVLREEEYPVAAVH